MAHDYTINFENQLFHLGTGPTVSFEISLSGYNAIKLKPNKCKKIEIKNAPALIHIKVTPVDGDISAPRNIQFDPDNQLGNTNCKVGFAGVKGECNDSSTTGKGYWNVFLEYLVSRPTDGGPAQTPVTITDIQPTLRVKGVKDK